MTATSAVFVLGAGAAGLSAAHHLGGAVEVFEKASYAGGHCRSKRVDGFLFDEGAHVFFGSDESSQRFVREPLATELVHHRADVWNDYGGAQFGRYPVQANLHALPADEITACLLDFVRAAQAPEREIADYEQWCRASFGVHMAERFMLRYARKIWTVEPGELNTEWLGSSIGGRVLRPSLEQVLRGAVDPRPQSLNYYSEFCYPREGGFERILAPISAGLASLRLGCGVSAIDIGARRLELADGSRRSFDALLSSIPLPSLVGLITDAPPEIEAAAARLMWTSVRLVSFGVRRPEIGPGHWVYFYEEGVPFFRASFPSTLAPGNAPPGHSSVTCEVAYSRRRPLAEAELVRRCRAALVEEGILDASDAVVVEDEMDAPFAYVVYDAERAPALAAILPWLESAGILAFGRFGEWGYHWSFDAIASGKRAAGWVRERLGG